MAVPKKVRELVELFERNREAYRSGRYNETQLRVEFIDPFFESLGWDVHNKEGYAEAYKDVIHEDAIKVGGATKAPDYCFRIGGTRKFFLEAKKPSIDIKRDVHPAYQLRRYAWSAKLPLSILTDFEEFAAYDCRIKPGRTDKASTARVFYLTYTDYIQRWDEIASIFSRDAVLKGSFDKYVESTKRKRGTAEVDAAFLKEIESWRESLARNIALRNPDLTRRELNFAVQRTIDRLIFLRICEDRGVEHYGQLMALQNGTEVYARLCKLFYRADERYNSGLFYFRAEKGRADTPDELTPRLTIDDKPLKEIVKRLYYPESPYEFSVLPADILGQVYEQFLGKVIRLTPAHRAVIEDKPEVKKAGGVYYTPSYIVDYIVKNTVGKLLGDKSHGHLAHESRARPPYHITPQKVSKLRFLDPACGSGSFLIGAYQYLLDWHRDFYENDDPQKWARRRPPRVYQAAGGEWRLTTPERKRILLDNIYGVDIDPQAVEVTKLSLLLKVLEGQSGQTIDAQYRFFRERALPDLASNIKCGNSLIGPDFYDNQQMTFLDEEERYRINAFDWNAEFPEIMKSGGFDAVIGNPPYLSYSGRQAAEMSQAEQEHLRARYRSAGWFTCHGMFIQRAAEHLSRRFVALIIPDQVGHLAGYRPVRETLQKTSGLKEVRYWGEKVFEGVTTPALTFIADQNHKGQTLVCGREGRSTMIPLHGAQPWVHRHEAGLIAKLQSGSRSLGNFVADPGVHTGNCSKDIILPKGDAAPHCVPILEGKQVSRYFCRQPTKAVRLNYTPKGGEYFTIRPRERYANADFLIRQTAPYPIVGPREHAEYFRNSLLALYSPSDGTNVRYLVGLLNSHLIRYVYRQAVHESHQKAFPQVKVRSLRELPIRTIDLSDPSEKARHDRMVKLVERMLELHKKLAAAKTAHDKTVLQRQIDKTDNQIDQLVYELYDLTEEEIAIVQKETRRA